VVTEAGDGAGSCRAIGDPLPTSPRAPRTNYPAARPVVLVAKDDADLQRWNGLELLAYNLR
jgi:hypothetical protein